MTRDGHYIPLRDYEYLDEDRLMDYLTTLDSEEIKQVKQTIREISGKSEGLGAEYLIRAIGLGPKSEVRTEDKQAEKRTITIMAKHSFTRLYEALDYKRQIKRFDELAAESINNINAGDIVEVTRNFRPLRSGMINSMIEMLQLHDEKHKDEDSRKLAEALCDCRSKKMLMFCKSPRSPGQSRVGRGGRDDSNPPEEGSNVASCSVVFSAERKFIIRESTSLDGQMTVCGKVKQVHLGGHRIMVLDALLGIQSKQIQDRHRSLRSEYKLVTSAIGGSATNESSNPWWRFWEVFSVKAQLDRRRRQEQQLREKRQRQQAEKWGEIQRGWGSDSSNVPAIRCPVIVVTPLAIYR